MVEAVQLLYLLSDEGDHTFALRLVEETQGAAVLLGVGMTGVVGGAIIVIKDDITYATAENLVLLDTVGFQRIGFAVHARQQSGCQDDAAAVGDQVEGAPLIAFPEPGNDTEKDSKRKYKKFSFAYYQNDCRNSEMNIALCFQDSGIRSRDEHQLLVHAQGTVDNAPFPLCEGFPLVKLGGIVSHGYV